MKHYKKKVKILYDNRASFQIMLPSNIFCNNFTNIYKINPYINNPAIFQGYDASMIININIGIFYFKYKNRMIIALSLLRACEEVKTLNNKRKQ